MYSVTGRHPPPTENVMSDAGQIYVQNLKRKLTEVANTVMPQALACDFEQAERTILAVDRDLYGQLAAAQLYISAIKSLGGAQADSKDLPRIRKLFDRAVTLRERAYPTPHTEVEAEYYEEGSKQDRGRTVDELGFDPHA